MSEKTQDWKCPNDCDTCEHPYPFFAPPCCLTGTLDEGHPETGIYVDLGGRLTDTWLDGRRGTSGWDWDDCLPHCPVCLEEVEPAKETAPNGFDIRATLRRVLPEGSTIWTVTQHVTRSGRLTVLPMAFEAADTDPRGELGLTIASCRYVLGREFCEKLGYRWDAQHQGWLGNYGEDASGSIVAALSMAAYDRPDAYSLGRTA